MSVRLGHGLFDVVSSPALLVVLEELHPLVDEVVVPCVEEMVLHPRAVIGSAPKQGHEGQDEAAAVPTARAPVGWIFEGTLPVDPATGQMRETGFTFTSVPSLHDQVGHAPVLDLGEVEARARALGASLVDELTTVVPAEDIAVEGLAG
jgi:hypothetical protein